jgi:hypothetical protein
MSAVNWAFIKTGPTFEGMVTALLFFEDPKAKLFGRPGKDGGQDAISGDGRTVLQAKYHEAPTIAKMIADTKAELGKISNYRKPGHSRYTQWRDVTEWRLVTNHRLNPTEAKEWEDAVLEPFAREGLSASYWSATELEALLLQHSEIARTYFENENRVLLSPREFLATASERSTIPFYSDDTTLQGRDDFRQNIDELMRDNHRYLIVTGHGGVGKSRLLAELGADIAGEGQWRVYWCNHYSMGKTTRWIDSILPEHDTLLLLDEPSDSSILEVLHEQFTSLGGRLSRWKAVIASRYPGDPALKPILTPSVRRHCREAALTALKTEAARTMCRELIERSQLNSAPDHWKNNTIEVLPKLCSNYPIWIAMAVELLERGEDLDSLVTANGVAARYAELALSEDAGATNPQLLAVARAISMFAPVNCDETAPLSGALEFIGSEDIPEPSSVVALLVSRGLVKMHGYGQSSASIKPDVIRDYLLREWLTIESPIAGKGREFSHAGKKLAKKITDSILGHRVGTLELSVVTAMVRVEEILRSGGLDLRLTDCVLTALQALASSPTPMTISLCASILKELARIRPLDSVRVAARFREASLQAGVNPVAVCGFAEPLSVAAHRAATETEQKAVLAELFELAALDASIEEGLGIARNHYRNPQQVLTEALAGNPYMQRNYLVVASEFALSRFSEFKVGRMATDRVGVYSGILRMLVSVERRQMWTFSHSIHIVTGYAYPGTLDWNIHERLLSLMKHTLESEEPTLSIRIKLWELIGHSHHQIRFHRGESTEEQRSQLHDREVADLAWALQVLKQGNRSHLELRAASGLWSWHVKYEQDSTLKSHADALSRIAHEHPLIEEFEELHSDFNWENRTERGKQIAEAIANSRDTNAVQRFLDRAEQYFEGPPPSHILGPVSHALGTSASQQSSIQDFVRSALRGASTSWRTGFAVHIAQIWVLTERRRATANDVSRLAWELIDLAESDDTWCMILCNVYAIPTRLEDSRLFSDAEIGRLRAHFARFNSANQLVLFSKLVSWGWERDWDGLRSILENCLTGVPLLERGMVFAAILESISLSSAWWKEASLHADVTGWLLDQYSMIPRLSAVGNLVEYEMGRLLAGCGKRPITWLATTIANRFELAPGEGRSGSDEKSSLICVREWMSLLGMFR